MTTTPADLGAQIRALDATPVNVNHEFSDRRNAYLFGFEQALIAAASLVAAQQPAEPFSHLASIRIAAGWKLSATSPVPVLYTDEINGQQVCRDDLWLAPTSALAKVQQPAGQAVAWVRYRSDGAIEGPVLNAQLEDVRKQSGAWTPLGPITSPTQQAGQAIDWRLTAARFIRDEIEQKKQVGWGNRVNELDGVAAKLEMLASASPYGLDCVATAIAPTPQQAAPTQPEAAYVPDELRDAIVACLGDDAAALRKENPDDEMADNMDQAADLIEALRVELNSALAAMAATPQPTAEPCEHEWVSARNQYVTSGEICAKLCGAVRSEQPTAGKGA